MNEDIGVQQQTYSRALAANGPPQSYSQGVPGVQSLPTVPASNVTASNLGNNNKPKTPRPQRNILYGTAKCVGEQKTEKLLAADIDHVAKGVSKVCSDEDLRGFLTDKGVNVIAIETLTRAEVLPNVRTKTFKVTVKAAQYEMVLKPDIWPYRVAVRHFRAPKRSEQSWNNQSSKTGGIISENSQNLNLGCAQTHLNPGVSTQHQETFSTPINVSNQFGILSDIGSKEVQAH